MKRTTDIRLSNITNLARIITRTGYTTRRALARDLGVSLMTVTTLVDQLLEMGIVVTLPEKNSSRNGRRADLLAPNTEGKRILILDLRDYSFCCGLMDLRLNFQGMKLHHLYESEKSYTDNLTQFVQEVKQEMQRACMNQQLLGLAVVVPGPFMSETGGVMNKRIPELCTLNLKELLGAHFAGIPTYVEEDVKFATYSLLEDSLLLEKKIVSYIYIGEGVGGGIINDLKIAHGMNSVAGDVGQMMADGNKNYEDLLSVRRLYRDVTGGDSSDAYSDILERLLEAQRQNPQKMESLLQMVYTDAAKLLYNIVWLLNPHIVTMDCDYLLQLDEDYCSKIEEKLCSLLQGRESYVPQIVFLTGECNNTYRGGALKVLELYIENVLGGGSETQECDNDEKKT